MASDSKVTALTANTTPALTDVLYIVDDPGGTPASQKVELTYVDSLFRSNGIAFVATASAAVANTGSETTLVGSGAGSVTLAANFFSVGKTMRLKAYGVASNTSTPTLNIQFKFGSTAIVATSAITTASGLSNTGWECEVYVTCRTTGGSGTVFAQGALWINSTRYPMVNAAADTVDTTATQAVGLTATWGAADPANTITCTNLIIEKLN